MNAIHAIMHIEGWKIQDFNWVWTCDLAIPVWRSNQLSNEATDVTGAGHLWVLMSPWGMTEKLYMNYFKYWTADVNLKNFAYWNV